MPKLYLSLLSTQDLLSKQRQLMQCCVQRFTLLEAFVDAKMINENRFLSPELKYKRSLIEIIRRLNSVPPRKDLHMYIFNFLDSKCNTSNSQYQYKHWIYPYTSWKLLGRVLITSARASGYSPRQTSITGTWSPASTHLLRPKVCFIYFSICR